MSTGSFDREFAQRKNWKLDHGLWLAILERLRGQTDQPTVADLGAGVGRYVAELRAAGYNAVGLDGIPGVNDLSEGRVYEVDFATETPHWETMWGAAPDAVISTEVGEHIPAEHAANYLRWCTEIPASLLIMSWAVPGQRGRDHINCRLPEWVASEVGKRGWVLDHDGTVRARATAGKGWDRKLLVFARP